MVAAVGALEEVGTAEVEGVAMGAGATAVMEAAMAGMGEAAMVGIVVAMAGIVVATGVVEEEEAMAEAVEEEAMGEVEEEEAMAGVVAAAMVSGGETLLVYLGMRVYVIMYMYIDRAKLSSHKFIHSTI